MTDRKFDPIPDDLEEKRDYKGKLVLEVNAIREQIAAVDHAIVDQIREIVGDNYVVQAKDEMEPKDLSPVEPGAGPANHEQVLAVLQDADEPIKRASIVSKLDAEPNSVTRALKYLEETGAARREGEKSGTKWVLVK